MKLGKIFIYINILVLSLLILSGCMSKETWPRIVYQPTYWTFDNRIIDIDDGQAIAMTLQKRRPDMTLFFILLQNEKKIRKRRRENIEDY